MPTDNQTTAEKGRRLVLQALRDRGAQVSELRQGRIDLLEIRHAAVEGRVHARVRTRTSGTWQGSILDGHPAPSPSHPPAFWIYVDLERPGRPRFFVVPDAWMRKDIYDAHQEYLARHGGERAISKDSRHHAIQPRRVLQWENRWDLLGL